VVATVAKVRGDEQLFIVVEINHHARLLLIMR